MDKTTQITLLALLALTVALQIWATISLVRVKESYSRTQFVSQLVITWVVPILGAVLCLFFASLTGAPARSPRKKFLDPADADDDDDSPSSASTFYGEGGGDQVP
jgi:hypothetical protein